MTTFLQVLYSDELNEVVGQWADLLELDPEAARENLQRRLSGAAYRGARVLTTRQWRAVLVVLLASERARRGQPSSPMAASEPARPATPGMTLKLHASRLVAAIPAYHPARSRCRRRRCPHAPARHPCRSRPAAQQQPWRRRLVRRTVSHHQTGSSVTRPHPDHDGRTSPCCTNSATSASARTTTLSTGSQTEQTLPVTLNACVTRSLPRFSSPPQQSPGSSAARLPAPGHLQQLYAASRASEEVCAIALAACLPARGAIALIQRRSATVAFAAASGWPPLPMPRGLALPPSHPLRDLGTRQRWSGWTTPDLRLAFNTLPPTAKRSSSSFPWTQLLRTQAEAGPRRTIAVLLDITRSGETEKDGPQAAREPDYTKANAPRAELVCQVCGHAGIREHYPCPECGVPPCPACGRCPCL